MPRVTEYAPGSFSWMELGTPDAAAAKAFYAGLLGWIAHEVPGARGAYTLLKKDGVDVAGLYGLAADAARWTPYFTVADADAAAAAAISLGGEVAMPPVDVGDRGRLATLRDPAGAVFSVWQARGHAGSGLQGEPGSPCWSELLSHQPARARTFYTGLLGWTAQVMPSTAVDYTFFKRGDTVAGGLMRIPPEWQEMPSRWMAYVAVEDCEAAVGRAEQLGGRVDFPPTDVRGFGRFAYVQDPQGAPFALIRLQR